MNKSLLRSGAIVSAMTLISRVLGLVRDVAIANLLGAKSEADVFFFANKIPNFLRRLFAEGAFAQAFVPVFTETKEKGELSDVQALVAKVSGTLGVIVTIVTLLGVVGAPLVTALFGTGWFLDWLNDGPNAGKFERASVMLQITFPYLWFITFTALSGAVLNSLGKFAVAAFTPVFLNVVIIAFALWISPDLAQPELGLAWGVFFGGLVQFAFQIPFLFQAKMLVKPSWGWHTPGVVKIRTLMLPALFGVSVSQINLLFDTLIASFLMTGSISWLYYSDRLLEFPLGLFGIAIATVILPHLSARHVSAGKEAFAATVDWGVRAVCCLGFPAAMGLIVLAQPMLIVLFMHGAFEVRDSQMASYSLIAYGSGLLSFMLVKVLAPGYYARQDTRTPVRYGIIAMASNMVFNLIFAIPFGYVGLAMATSLSATLNAFLLYRGLKVLDVFSLSMETILVLCRMMLAALCMAVTIAWLQPDEAGWLALSFDQRVFTLMGLIVTGGAVYLALLAIFGIRPKHLAAHGS